MTRPGPAAADPGGAPAASPALVVGLPLRDRPVLVAGATAAALGAIVGLLDRGARVTVTVEADAPAAAVVDLAERGALTLVGRPLVAEQFHRFWLIVAATGDPDRDLEVARLADAVGRFCLSDRLLAVDLPAGPAAAALGVPVVPVERDQPGEAPDAPADRVRGGRVVLVGGGPGDPGLLTVAGAAALRTADVVLVDRLAPLAALADLKAGVEVIDVSKIPRGRFTPQEEINRLLVEHGTAGRQVVRLKGGDNFVFGRGGEEWEACAAAGVPVTVIPGVSAALAAPALAGIPVTHRTMTQGFTVVSGHVPPGDPASTLDWPALARSGTTLILLMAVKNLPLIAAELLADGMPPDTPAATVADAGSSRQRTVRSTLADLPAATAAAGIGAPAVTVIGAVAGFDPGTNS